MCCQIGRLSESLAAVRILARIRLVPIVNSLVRFQIEIEGKAATTYFTHVRFFARMNQQVSFELRVIQEFLPAPLIWTIVDFVEIIAYF